MLLEATTSRHTERRGACTRASVRPTLSRGAADADAVRTGLLGEGQLCRQRRRGDRLDRVDDLADALAHQDDAALALAGVEGQEVDVNRRRATALQVHARRLRVEGAQSVRIWQRRLCDVRTNITEYGMCLHYTSTRIDPDICLLPFD